jgi:hypothetical protein
MDEEKVVPMFGGPKPGEPDPKLIQKVEWLMTQVMTGHVSGLAAIILYTDGSHSTGWNVSEDCVAGTSVRLLGAVTVLGHRLAVKLEE